jgi:anti-sigma-K factor RskA
VTAGTACAECRQLLGGYVLHALDPEETEIVRDHVAACPDCARELAELEDVPHLLDVAELSDASPEQPPAALEEAVLDRFAREHRGARPRRPRALPALRAVRERLSHPLPAAVAAGLAAAIVAVLLTQALQPQRSSEPAAAYHAKLFAAAPDVGGGSGYATLRTLPTGTEVHLKVKEMPTGTPAVYEMWCLGDDGTKVSAGTFRLDASGRANVRLTAAARLGEYHRVSVEKRELGASSGRRVLAGEIGY